jgi:preprotein translocase subunit SecG
MIIVCMLLLGATAFVLIGLILMQRGKGGGLAGAFGGLGGQSAFGTKAGDAFTKITIVVAAFWILLCIASARLLAISGGRLRAGGGGPVQESVEQVPGGDEADGAGGLGGASGDGETPSDSPDGGGE